MLHRPIVRVLSHPPGRRYKRGQKLSDVDRRLSRAYRLGWFSIRDLFYWDRCLPDDEVERMVLGFVPPGNLWPLKSEE